MKITRRKRSKQSYTKPSVSLIELESVPLLAKSNDGDSGGAKGIEPLGGVSLMVIWIATWTLPVTPSATDFRLYI